MRLNVAINCSIKKSKKDFFCTNINLLVSFVLRLNTLHHFDFKIHNHDSYRHQAVI